ncbi:hypothetical protein FLONG3_7325 [Fusarium longipes]|uniref:BTB domain-containing protein n=1 Tax=Fusarium longipes TaxID=694270 RepID=A0A395SFK6_9HYPO|nr:hypothetical protein FLONG3_7325 [Fusarium longipes]
MSASLDTENGDKDCSCTLQVGEDGDVILVVGPKENRVQVHSSFLKYISPVFRAMLDAPMLGGDGFRSKLESDVPFEITLPEDDSRAIVQALRALYGTDLSAKLTPRDIKNVVVLADKYGFTMRLQHFGHYWLQIHPHDLYCPGQSWDLAIAAYLLQNNQAFFDITKKLVTNGESLLAYAKNESDKHLGMQLGMAIEEVRNRCKDGGAMGICLDCFINNTDSFVIKGDLCKYPKRHKRFGPNSWGGGHQLEGSWVSWEPVEDVN